MEQQHMDVIIIGGSIAGLLHGIMLKKLGHCVHILERNLTSDRKNHAAGVVTGPKGQEFMNTYDCDSPLQACHYTGYQFLDKNSRIKKLFDKTFHATSWVVVYYRLRALFDGLSSSIYPNPPTAQKSDGKVYFELGKNVTDITLDGDLVDVEFVDLLQNGTSGTQKAHLVIDASGAYSVTRQKFMPGLNPTFAGFVAWRGMVPENTVPQRTRELLKTRFTVFPMRDNYIIGYAVPGENGETGAGQRLLNFIWYQKFPKDSLELKRAMTDTAGYTHRNTLPFGMMNPSVWADQVAYAKRVLNPTFLDLIKATQRPFISTIRDSSTPNTVFLDGRLLLVGEATYLHRPNGGVAMNQAATQCLLLRDVLEGKMSIRQWEASVLDTGHQLSLYNALISSWYLSKKLEFIATLGRYLLFGFQKGLSKLWRLIFGF